MSANCSAETCGNRCSDCDERMCDSYGPHPGLCLTHCEDHEPGCLECALIAAERQADLDHDYAKEASA